MATYNSDTESESEDSTQVEMFSQTFPISNPYAVDNTQSDNFSPTHLSTDIVLQAIDNIQSISLEISNLVSQTNVCRNLYLNAYMLLGRRYSTNDNSFLHYHSGFFGRDQRVARP